MPFITIPASKKHKSLLEHDKLSEEEKPDSDDDVPAHKDPYTTLVIKISDALNSGLLSYEDYEVSWSIPCVLHKSGLSLLIEKDFNVLVRWAANLKGNDLTINITIIQKENYELKENEAMIEPTVNEKPHNLKPSAFKKSTGIQNVAKD
ncbi:hypothetical protein EV702DRAFT_1043202 [Suillus placidus]|uniref:Uncharacterized protein n=1 Tax=Suillus placidus TaxID=48579 RepID=A0A9P7A0Y0_9AGAM|nr:hypothetical protein EV702DRAFT_1043202 [Suillus placidus]